MSRKDNEIWFVVSRCFIDGKFSIKVIPFKNESEAWQLIEEEFDDSNSQNWLLSIDEYKTLKKLVSTEVI